MPDNVKFKSPVIPNPPTEYNQSLFQRTFNILRIYFNQLDNHLRGELGNTTVDGFLEVIDADAGTKEKPIIALYRNSPSPANNDKLGAIRWFGQADSGEKKLFGQIYTKAADIGDASEQGEMVFTVAADNGLTSSVASAVTDITADIANDIDPAFTITQNEVKIPGTNNFMIDGYDNGGLIKFKESGGNVGTVNFVDITGDRSVQFPDASGTVITSGNLSAITSVGTLAQDTLEITSTDAGAGEKPNVSLYRNSSSPAASDEMGSIDFYGNDSAGNKTLYGQIYTEASVVTNGSEQAHLNFAVASGSSGFEDPVVRMRKYALEVLPNNTLDLHQNSFIKFEGSTNDANETSLKAANPTADREITLPDATGTVVLNESGTISETATTLQLTDTTTGSTTENPSIELYRNGGAGADGHELGAIKFFGNNDAGTPEKIEYAKIYAELIDASDGTEDGSLKFHLLSNGSSEDPVMTLQQFGLIMASGNSIYLGANGTLSFEGTDETNNLETAIVATNPTADRTITLPDSTGTVALTDVTNTAEFFEIASATASSADNACHPVLSIYDNADRSGQSNNPSGGLNNSGALRFYFNNKAGDKTFAAGMRAMAIDIEDGEERGGIEFCLPTGSAGDVVTDVTASHSNIESPVMSLFKYGLVMAANNDIFLHDNDDVIKWSGASQSLRGRTTETSGTSTITLPDATGTLAHIADNGGLQHPALSSNPSSPANGQTYYNTSDHKLKLYANGAWVDLN